MAPLIVPPSSCRGLLSPAVGGLDQAVDRVSRAVRRAEAPEAVARGRAKRMGAVDEDDDLSGAVLAAESARRVAGHRARVSPDGAAAGRYLLETEPVGEQRRRAGDRLHGAQLGRSEQVAAEQRPEEAREVLGVRHECPGGPDDRGTPDAYVLERAQEIAVRVLSGNARSSVEARGAQVQRLEDPPTQLRTERLSRRRLDDQAEDVVIRVGVAPPRARGEGGVVRDGDRDDLARAPVSEGIAVR